MPIDDHLRTAGGALKNWAIAQISPLHRRAVADRALLPHVPLYPLWAILAALLQIIPHLGPVFSLVGPLFRQLLFEIGGVRLRCWRFMRLLPWSMDSVGAIHYETNAKVRVWASISHDRAGNCMAVLGGAGGASAAGGGVCV